MDISQDESPTMWQQDETRTGAEEATEEDGFVEPVGFSPHGNQKVDPPPRRRYQDGEPRGLSGTYKTNHAQSSAEH